MCRSEDIFTLMVQRPPIYDFAHPLAAVKGTEHPVSVTVRRPGAGQAYRLADEPSATRRPAEGHQQRHRAELPQRVGREYAPEPGPDQVHCQAGAVQLRARPQDPGYRVPHQRDVPDETAEERRESLAKRSWFHPLTREIPPSSRAATERPTGRVTCH